ncbi:unnamed protein product [Paramecium primaurelia]|uniref:RING-type domain-containing protein n=1 Tax=Paramecium primaurelia TaxID=5886 RepID=A0A8S1N5P5_PARPR|nr:unnamed protein product [Paramecium primaurelia]
MLENIKYLLIPHSRERYGIYPIVLREVFSQLSRNVQIYIYFTISKLLIALIFLGDALKCELSESHSTAMTVILHCIFLLYHEFKYKMELENVDKLNLIQFALEQQGMNLEQILDRQSFNKLMMTVKKLIFSQCLDLNREQKYLNFLAQVIIIRFFILMLNSPFNFNMFQYFQETCDADLLNVMFIVVLSMFLEFIFLYFLVFMLVIALPLLCCLSIYRKGKQLYSIRRLKKYLDSIPPHKYTGLDDTWVKEDKTCCICMQEYVQQESILQLPCSGQHQFHEGCIRNWFNVSTSCPICRQQLG